MDDLWEERQLLRLTLHWYDGGQKPSSDLIGGQQVAGNGTILVGERGTLYSIGWTGGDWHFLPQDKFRDWKPPAATVVSSLDGADRQRHLADLPLAD